MKRLLVIGTVALVFVELFMGALGCGRAPVRVRGTVVDATTGGPVEGAALLTLRDPETGRDPAALQEWRTEAAPWLLRTQEDQARLPWHVGWARTDAAGAFEIVVGIGISHRYGGLSGIPWFTERGSAFHVARALLVERDGYASLVHETKDARWEERPDGKIVGTLDVGTIRLAPAAPR